MCDCVSVLKCIFSFINFFEALVNFLPTFYKMAAAMIAGIGAGLAYIGCVLCCKAVEYCQHKKEEEAHQQEDIYNISSRVQDQWPTHDAHLSIDHISILNQMNKSIYNDAPPSYEEVMKTAVQTNGEASTPTEVIVVAPKTISTTTSLRQQ